MCLLLFSPETYRHPYFIQTAYKACVKNFGGKITLERMMENGGDENIINMLI
jgi:hypothetical protein